MKGQSYKTQQVIKSDNPYEDYDFGYLVKVVNEKNGKRTEYTYRKNRIVHGFIPLLGPLYLLGKYIAFKLDKDARKKIKEQRTKLEEIVAKTKKDFNLAI